MIMGNQELNRLVGQLVIQGKLYRRPIGWQIRNEINVSEYKLML